MNLLNLACGNRFHRDWINIDFYSQSKLVRSYNLLKKLPFKNNSIDVIYTGHFLEHLTVPQTKAFLAECFRILKEGGIIRIVVPDLESSCKEYLQQLDNVRINRTDDLKYRWSQLELLDQLVRTKSGGGIHTFYQSLATTPNQILESYIFERVGENLDFYRNNSLRNKTTLSKIKNKLLYTYIHFVSFLIPRSFRNSIINETSIGEKHLWMYDSYSLAQLVKSIGFQEIFTKHYNSSEIPNFNIYNLDSNKDGSPYKGVSSLYMEAIK